MKEAVTKVIDTLTQEGFHGAFKKLLERYNKCIAAGGDYFEMGLEFQLCTIDKSGHTKKVCLTLRYLSYAPRTSIDDWISNAQKYIQVILFEDDESETRAAKMDEFSFDDESGFNVRRQSKHTVVHNAYHDNDKRNIVMMALKNEISSTYDTSLILLEYIHTTIMLITQVPLTLSLTFRSYRLSLLLNGII